MVVSITHRAPLPQDHLELSTEISHSTSPYIFHHTWSNFATILLLSNETSPPIALFNRDHLSEQPYHLIWRPYALSCYRGQPTAFHNTEVKPLPQLLPPPKHAPSHTTTQAKAATTQGSHTDTTTSFCVFFTTKTSDMKGPCYLEPADVVCRLERPHS